jgi:hypothetical protein
MRQKYLLQQAWAFILETEAKQKTEPPNNGPLT